MEVGVSTGVMMAEAMGAVYRSWSDASKKRYEALAQHQLGFILRQPGELELFVRNILKRRASEWLTVSEERVSSSGGRFDHEITNAQDDVIAVIEDKIFAGFSPGQIESYAKDIGDVNRRPVVLVLLPEHRKPSLSELRRTTSKVEIKVESWRTVCATMAAISPNEHLWATLSDFAEQAGLPSLQGLPSTEGMNNSDLGRDAGDLVRSAQAVARHFWGNERSPLTFSFHGGNQRVWIQSGMTSSNYGVELDFESSHCIYVAKNRPSDWYAMMIGQFRGGKLSRRAVERVEGWRRSASSKYPTRDLGRFIEGLPWLGTRPKQRTSEALRVAAAVFQPRYLTGAAVEATHVRSARGSRIGAVLTLEAGNRKREVGAFIGPPHDRDWDRVAVYIAADGKDSPLVALPNESGPGYVRRVWAELHSALHD